MLLRRVIGDVLRRHRVAQSRTLRDVSHAAGVSLGYLSEVERGRKEASSELLAAICSALAVELSELLREVGDELARQERRQRVTPIGFTIAAPDVARVPAGVAGARPVATMPSNRGGFDPRRPAPMREPRPAGPGREPRPTRIGSGPIASLAHATAA